ncbi:OmpA family protein [Rhizobium sp. LCM 4573]|uniref:OmpA family protein n=1 Tax=Rhizobium sp. LCM 4573 TaxID=1848291 RepID=UPI0008DA3EF6|nr:OmpA family protein [Rhizobium sp. LCM 4573]OHV81219.1 hypothetical protein LCM4573_22155 [Rhizobium sp. LCM 4573]
MSKKFKLFSSVAMPFVSLPLMIQPAGAMPSAPHAPLHEAPAVIEVQQRILPPGAEEGEEGEGRRKRREEPQQQEEPQQEPQRQERPQEERPEPAPERQREAPPEVEQRAPEPEARPERREAPREEEPRREEAPQAEPERQQERESRPERERQREAAPEGERPAEGEAAPERRQREGAPSGRGEPERRQVPESERAPEGERQPESREAPAEQRQAPAEGEQQDRQPETRPETRQDGQQAPSPSDGQTPAQPSEQAPGQQTAPDSGQAPSTEPGTTPAEPGTTPAEPGAAPAEGGQTQDGAAVPTAPAEGQQQAQPQPPTTPEEVERARQIAEDPASAPADQPVVLPVENGAAVLDSAKEGAPQGARERPRRGDGQPGGQAEGQPAAPDQGQPAQAEAPAEPPKSDEEAQAFRGGDRPQIEIRAVTEEQGERLDRRPEFERQRGWEYRDLRDSDLGSDRDRDDGRVIISIDNRTFVRHDDSRRFYREGYEPEYERLRGGRIREVIDRDGGVQIVTIRNRYGEIVQRSRIVDGEEYVLYYAPDMMEDRPDYVWRDPGLDLPPMRLTVPLDEYIIDTSSEPDRDYYEFLEQPPVERVERVYSLDEVRYSARIRDKVRRIDLDTITFATGSAEIPMNQASSLRQVAEAMNRVLEGNPGETFLIEGHTDAVGSDESNLILSDRRAESVATVLTEAFGIPPENLATQGYGERYLKIRTEGPEQENRRVTIRRITPLVKPVASNR